MKLNPFKKIDVGNIKLQVSKDQVAFSYEFDENDEKALNLSAGRIHRETTSGSGVWKLEGAKLSVAYANLTEKEIVFGEIAELFEEMVK